LSKKIYVIISFLVIFSFACSKDKQKKFGENNIKPAKSQKLVKQQKSKEEDNEIRDIVDNSFDDTGIDDHGEPCVNHEYYIDQGVNKSLHFSILFKYDNERNVDISIDDSKIKDPDFGISSDSCEVISKTLSYPIWIIDAEEMIRDSRENHAKYNNVVERLVRLTFRRPKSNDFCIEFSKDNNIGVIRAYSSPEIFGKKNEIEVAEFLDSEDLTIRHGKYSFQVERDYLEKEINILSFDISVTTPFEGKETHSSFDVILNIDPKIKKSIPLSLLYDAYKKQYIVRGPGYDVDCDDTDQY